MPVLARSTSRASEAREGLIGEVLVRKIVQKTRLRFCSDPSKLRRGLHVRHPDGPSSFSYAYRCGFGRPLYVKGAGHNRGGLA